MSMRSVLLASLLNSASKVDKKGLRDMGLLAELERSDWFAGEGKPGEVALLRKGLLEDRLRESPGEGRRSAVDKVSNQGCDQRAPNFVTERRAARVVKRAPKGASPGIDGSASIVAAVAQKPCKIRPNQTREAGRLQMTAGW